MQPLKASNWKAKWDEAKPHVPPGMKWLSIFHKLPYWGDLLINHLLDPMHIFKNVAQQIWDHITSARDNLGVREDLQLSGRLPIAWPRAGQKLSS